MTVRRPRQIPPRPRDRELDDLIAKARRRNRLRKIGIALFFGGVLLQIAALILRNSA
jgi:hypothetical protein